MLSFYADRFIKLSNYLTTLESSVENLIREKGAAVHVSSFPEESIQLIAAITEELRRIKSDVPARHAKALADYVHNEGDMDACELKSLAHAVRWSFVYELAGKLVLMVPPDRAVFYEIKETFLGTEVLSKCGNINEDAAEAGNCFALGRYTACVFHLMRIMERLVQRMGRNLGVPETITCEKEWQAILNQIRSKVKLKWPKEKAPERIRYEAVIDRLETVKRAWRNPTMHPKATYTEDEARALIDSVKSFIGVMASLPEATKQEQE